MLCHVPRGTWLLLSLCYRRIARYEASERVIARRAAALGRLRVRELRAARPTPLTSFDVGVAPDGSLLYRSNRGVVSSAHPALSPSEHVATGSALLEDGSLEPPLQPLPDSPFDLCPDASGAICYVNRATGVSEWDAPLGSTPLEPRPLRACSLYSAPPRVPPGLGYAALHGTQWHPLYQDHQGLVRLYNAETGAVREGPWVSLRSQPHGIVFYANLDTGDTRWLPPHRWMEGWISRPWRQHVDGVPLSWVSDSVFEGHRLAQALLPIALARQRTEGGAPPLYYERGLPQYKPDDDDTPDTHPLACWPALPVA